MHPASQRVSYVQIIYLVGRVSSVPYFKRHFSICVVRFVDLKKKNPVQGCEAHFCAKHDQRRHRFMLRKDGHEYEELPGISYFRYVERRSNMITAASGLSASGHTRVCAIIACDCERCGGCGIAGSVRLLRYL